MIGDGEAALTSSSVAGPGCAGTGTGRFGAAGFGALGFGLGAVFFLMAACADLAFFFRRGLRTFLAGSFFLTAFFFAMRFFGTRFPADFFLAALLTAFFLAIVSPPETRELASSMKKSV
ncbi:MAG: hypothetical protein HY290_05930 [Planctomycetia bacterium]|nr:hypothetical protein [Planctomycetia bacterium]